MSFKEKKKAIFIKGYDMEDQGNSPELKDFVRKIIAIDIGLFLVASVVALSLHIDFGIILFGFGMLSATVGSFLGGSPPYDPKHPRIQQSKPFERPSAANLSARILHNIKNSVPQFALENVLLYAGLAAILFSMPFICQIMF